ncbi:basigin isoform X2 [Macaca nemestrina]|uniref:basigin isoform X2 n=1 Tax=Macaca nemestrina TaxID=9545 RepID=UPI0003ABC440|nr:PREDICTED: basigin isoform X2 [Macaca fascicularis]XP_011747785.1 basigin isoform X2 [Macaca nemestrina]
MAATLFVLLGLALLGAHGASGAAGFVQAPLSQQRWVGGSVELHCEAVGSPVPEIQWWFEGHGPNDTCSQLWDGARLDRVHIHATYHQHAASTISIDTLAEEDTGTYECRASNDPDRNHLTRAPRVKWVRAQAVVLVLEPGTVSTSVENIGSKTLLTCSLNDSSTEVTGHRWLKGGAVLKEDTLPGQKTDFEVDSDDLGGEYSCVFLPEPTGRADIQLDALLSGAPRVKAVKSSEHVSEGETAVLACKSESLPPVTTWVWYKITDSGDQVIVNGSQGRFFVSSSQGRSELRIENLNMEADPGKYACNGTSSEGTDQATVTLRVRSHLAALWPFLGIVAEVLVLVTIIFIYEKRRKPEDVLDDDDAGSAPLKSTGQHLNDKGKKVRQRNSS